MPAWFFDLCNPKAGNTDLIKIANATYDSYFPEGINNKTHVYVLSKLAVAGTILGRKEATKFLIPNQIRTAEIATMQNRMTLREGYQTTGVQNLGRIADALHYALLNSSPATPASDPVISVFPAWPEDWDADYKLLARGNFLVTSSFHKGKVAYIEVISQKGGECRINNPWKDSDITCTINGKATRVKGQMLNFKTKSGDRIILKPARL
jgi:hypothetical protein